MGREETRCIMEVRKWRTANLLTWFTCSAGKYDVFSFVNVPTPPPPPPSPRGRQHTVYLILKPSSHCFYFLQCMRQDTIAS